MDENHRHTHSQWGLSNSYYKLQHLKCVHYKKLALHNGMLEFFKRLSLAQNQLKSVTKSATIKTEQILVITNYILQFKSDMK